jgi:uncharacterized protein YdaU (DUF1376 family)
MRETWQQWYAHYIDRWLSSDKVEDLSDAAYRAYHRLIMRQFQQPDGMLPDDENELARLSRKVDEWDQIRDEVMQFFPEAGDGRRCNPFQYSKWCDARDAYLKSRRGAAETNSKRWGKSRKSQGESQSESGGESGSDDETVAGRIGERVASESPIPVLGDRPETETETEPEQNQTQEVTPPASVSGLTLSAGQARKGDSAAAQSDALLSAVSETARAQAPHGLRARDAKPSDELLDPKTKRLAEELNAKLKRQPGYIPPHVNGSAKPAAAKSKTAKVAKGAK